MGYSPASIVYNSHVSKQFTVGDVIRKARIGRKWNQDRLGNEAAKFIIHGNEGRINKSTVSKVEKEPYSSELGTVARLLAALGLPFAEVERELGILTREKAIQARAPDSGAPTVVTKRARR